jgi:hypothetical protein
VIGCLVELEVDNIHSVCQTYQIIIDTFHYTEHLLLRLDVLLLVKSDHTDAVSEGENCFPHFCL